MRALVYAIEDEQRESPEQTAPGLSRVQGPVEDTADYWAMLWTSVQAALLTLVGQFVFTIYLALQQGIPVEIRLWKRVVPQMAMNISQVEFANLIMWSSILTAVVLGLFAVSAVLRTKRLQVQAGRAFAWLDMALLGFLALTRAWWFDSSLYPTRWMYALVLVGLVGFAVTTALIWIDYKDRTEAAEATFVDVEGAVS